MGRDYYQILGVDKNATAEQLKAAYKKQAVKWHPDKNMNQREAAEERFKLIAEAYDVLNDPQKRQIYDMYGEEGLKGGMPPPGSSNTAAEGPSFTYSGADNDMARRLFESLFGGAGGFTFSSMPGAGGPGNGSFQFMSTGPGGTAFASSSGPGGSSRNPFNIHTSGMGAGTNNNRRRWASAFGGNSDSDEEMFAAGAPGADPFASFFQQQQRQHPGSNGQWSGSSAGSSLGFGFGAQQQQQQSRQPAPQMVALPLTLEELYSGCTKRLKVTRHVMDAASGKSLPVQEVLEVPVKPGWKEGTRVTFAGKGDEVAPGTAADLVFVVKQQPHARFERKGNDLHTRVKLPLVTALTGGNVSVPMPDGRALSLPISATVQPGGTRLVVGEGMPISKGGKGDLHITFDVVFPTQLTSQQKMQLRQILPAA